MSTPKVRLLLVDDDNALRELLSVILKHSGYEVRSARDGFSALKAIGAEMPDVLLSDLYMPGMSGFELLSVVRRRFPLIPVVAMSSAYRGGEVPTGVAADAFYEKATDLDALLGLVHDVKSLPAESKPKVRKTVAPMWVGWKMDGTEDKIIMLSCPECLRNFSHVRAESRSVVNEAKCLYCSAVVTYAVVQQTSPDSPQRLLPLKSPMANGLPVRC